MTESCFHGDVASASMETPGALIFITRQTGVLWESAYVITNDSRQKAPSIRFSDTISPLQSPVSRQLLIVN